MGIYVGDRGNGRRLLRVVRTHPRQQRVPTSGVLTCAEHTQGNELGKEGRAEAGGEDRIPAVISPQELCRNRLSSET